MLEGVAGRGHGLLVPPLGSHPALCPMSGTQPGRVEEPSVGKGVQAENEGGDTGLLRPYSGSDLADAGKTPMPLHLHSAPGFLCWKMSPRAGPPPGYGTTTQELIRPRSPPLPLEDPAPARPEIADTASQPLASLRGGASSGPTPPSPALRPARPLPNCGA